MPGMSPLASPSEYWFGNRTVLAVVGFGALGRLLLVYAYILLPVKLSAVARDVASGHMVEVPRLEGHSDDEIGQLAENIGSMLPTCRTRLRNCMAIPRLSEQRN